jgi:Ca2+-binding RTX toxin-like protein
VTVKLNGLSRSYTFAALSRLHADLAGGNDTASVELDSDRATVNGGAGDDTLTGGAGAQNFFGGDGNDRLVGGPGDDRLAGDGGDDTLDGGTGMDAIFGGPGADTVDYSSRTAALYIVLGSGGGEAGENDDLNQDVEIVLGGAGNDYIAEFSWATEHATGVEEPRNTLYGGAGNDTLDGGSGEDALFGGPGDDTLLASEFYVSLFDPYGPNHEPRYSADHYSGGTGNDTIDYSGRKRADDGLAVSLDGVANDGRLAGRDHGAEGDNVDADVENVIGGGGDDRLSGSAANNRLVGNGGNDILRGGAGDDVLDGGAGRDWMLGGPGNDTADYSSRTRGLRLSLNGKFDDGEPGERDNVFADVETVIGGSGNDVLTGSAANNRLEGRDGNDTLTGGAGKDWLLGGNGDDTLFARDGITDFLLDGGPGNADRADKDATDPTQDVEFLLQPAIVAEPAASRTARRPPPLEVLDPIGG